MPLIAGLLPLSGEGWAYDLSLVDDPLNTERHTVVYGGPKLVPATCPTAPDATTELTLGQAVEFALCNNVDTRSSYLALKSQAASFGASQASYLPNVSGSVSGSKSVSFTKDPSSKFKSRGTSASVSMGMTLYDFGQREASVDAAEQALIAAGYTYNSTLQGVIGGTLQGYYRLLTSQSAVDAAKEALAAAQESLKASKLRYEVGLVPYADQLQAQTTLSQSELALTQAENRVQIDRAAFAKLLGLKPDAPMRIANIDDAALEKAPLDGNVEQLMEQAKTQRADLAARSAQLQGARASYRATRRADLPTISASAGQGFSDMDVFNNSTTRSQSIGISVSIPIFSGFSQHYNVKSAARQLEAQEIQYEQAERDIMQDVWNSWHNYETAERNWRTTKDLVASAVQVRDVTQGRYNEGLGTILDVLSAQAQYSSALQTRVQATFDLLSTRADLVRAVGLLNLETMRSEKLAGLNP